METQTKKKSVLKIVGNVVFWVVLGIVVIYSAFAFTSKTEGQVSSVFGKSGLVVLSDSMEPTFSEGDLLWVDVIEYDKFDFSTLKVGDVISFQVQEIQGQETITYINTHRIVNIIEDINGYYHFYTKGDNAPADPEPVSEGGVLAVWTGSAVSGAGKVVEFLTGSWGFFLFLVVPCFAFLVYEVFRFVKIVSEYNVQKAVGDKQKLQAEAIAMARAQLEAEMKAKQEAEKKPE